MGLGVGLAAIGAAEALQPVAMLAKATAFDFAIRAVHVRFGLFVHESIIQQALAVYKYKKGAPGIISESALGVAIGAALLLLDSD